MKKEQVQKIAVITGGASGIGKGIADQCRAGGYKVIVISLEDLPQDDGTYFKCDITNEQKVKEVIETIAKEQGKIDVLVNCAGFGMSGALELSDSAVARKMMDVNFWGAFYCFKYAVPFMPRGSKIINIGSVCALFVPPWRGFYAATKSAVQSLSYGMRMELAHLGIDVCCVNPGEVKTNFTKSRVKNFQTNERYGKRIENATLKVDAGEDHRMTPEFVAKKIYKQIKKKKCRHMIIISKKYTALNILVGLFGMGFVLNMATKIFSKE
ncbi:MAG: SDR family NAD(P)-dependent oxidoreductase [Firmicutes bacterium]|nr:SDR family NAD(P)-dependent oxidoreductase [Bacillota bacterium]